MGPYGNLYLIPTRLGDNPPLEVLPISIKRIIEELDHYIVENEKTARAFIKRVVSSKSQPDLIIKILNKYTSQEDRNTFLNPCLEGLSVGLLSEAGCPAIADPGSEIVRLAHQMGIRVVPMVGPSSIILALMSSGLNGQHFCFHGYLPIEKSERKVKIKLLERQSGEMSRCEIFIETPYRNTSIMDDLIKTLNPNTKLCVACDLTLPTEYIRTKTIHEWIGYKEDFHKRPAIFLIQKD